MSDLNKVIVAGNMTNDLNERSFAYIGNGTAKLSINIAVNKSVKRGDSWDNKASFIEVVMWGKLAERVKNYAKKGQRFVVCGSLEQDTWEKDGQKHSKVYINADVVELSTVCKGENTNSDQGQATSGFQPIGNEFPEDDIPFGN